AVAHAALAAVLPSHPLRLTRAAVIAANAAAAASPRLLGRVDAIVALLHRPHELRKRVDEEEDHHGRPKHGVAQAVARVGAVEAVDVEGVVAGRILESAGGHPTHH